MPTVNGATGRAGRIGSWWLSSEEALPTERPLWSVLANHLVSPLVSANGRLFVTIDRILFCPHRLDDRVIGGTWQASRARIESVRVEPRPTLVLGLPTRSLLAVKMDDGATAHFLVFTPSRIARRLNATLFG